MSESWNWIPKRPESRGRNSQAELQSQKIKKQEEERGLGGGGGWGVKEEKQKEERKSSGWEKKWEPFRREKRGRVQARLAQILMEVPGPSLEASGCIVWTQVGLAQKSRNKNFWEEYQEENIVDFYGLNCSFPPNSHIEVLTTSPSDRDLVWI